MTIYVIRRRGDQRGWLKIGYSTNVDARLKSFETATPEGVEVVCIFEGTRSVERTLHRELEDYCVGGEWFAPSIEVLSAIERAKAGKYDSAYTSNEPRPLIEEPTVELAAHIVDETRFYLHELMLREFKGAGDSFGSARDRVMQSAGLPASYGFRLWNKSHEMNDVPGEVYRRLRLVYALATEAEGVITDMQVRFLRTARMLDPSIPAPGMGASEVDAMAGKEKE